jgi:hypothetical protein
MGRRSLRVRFDFVGQSFGMLDRGSLYGPELAVGVATLQVL